MATEMTLTTAEVVCKTGVTARQLQWWDETGLIVPSKDKRNRQYDLRHLLAVLLLKELTKRGVSMKRVRAISWLEVAAREAIDRDYTWAVFDSGVRMFSTAHEALQYLRSSRAFATCVDLKALRDQATAMMDDCERDHAIGKEIRAAIDAVVKAA